MASGDHGATARRTTDSRRGACQSRRAMRPTPLATRSQPPASPHRWAAGHATHCPHHRASTLPSYPTRPSTQLRDPPKPSPIFIAFVESFYKRTQCPFRDPPTQMKRILPFPTRLSKYDLPRAYSPRLANADLYGFDYLRGLANFLRHR